MRPIALILLVSVSLLSQQKEVRSVVSYRAAGSVYVAAGRSQGVDEDAIAEVVRRGTTVARLTFVAASSRSSVWSIDTSSMTVVVGDTVLISVAVQEEPTPDLVAPPTPTDTAGTQPRQLVERRPARSRPFLQLSGRIGVRWYSTWFDDPGLNMYQPGVAVSLRGTVPETPFSFSFYANARETGRGQQALFSTGSRGTSRIYRAMIEYDDGTYVGAAGRLLLPFAPTTGPLDGVTLSRRFGIIQVGCAAGVQPDVDLQQSDTDRKKLALFVGLSDAVLGTQASLTYAKTWYKGAPDREVLSLSASSFAFDGFSIYAMSDIDLRSTSHGTYTLDPALSLLLVNVSARITQGVTASLGADASRASLPFSYARGIPDSLADTRLRNGLHAGVTVTLPYGLTVSTTFSPRSSGTSFGDEFTEYSYVSVSNAFRTGIRLRSSLVFSSTSLSRATGAGLVVSRSIFDIDLSARVQQTAYRMVRSGSEFSAITAGIDTFFPIVSRLTGVLSIDRTTGYGPSSLTLFAEISYRF